MQICSVGKVFRKDIPENLMNMSLFVKSNFLELGASSLLVSLADTSVLRVFISDTMCAVL